MASAPGTDEKFYVGTMDGWYLESELNSVAIGAHWICFLVLTITTFYLGWESWTHRGPSKRQDFYAGYQEEQNVALFVNFFAMQSYFGKIVADSLGHNFTNVGPFIMGFGNYRYADYMITCPMLVYDLLYQLRAPYRVSCSALIFAILLSGVIAEIYAEGDPRLLGGKFAWYGFGLFWFFFAYAAIMTLVAKQYSRLADLARDTGAEHSLHVLKFAVFTFSMLWVLFPLVWAICPRGLNWIDDNWTEVAHSVCDIVAKSCYGWALARFRNVYDTELFRLLEQLGHDEEEYEKVQLDMRLSSSGERLRRLSNENSLAKEGSLGLGREGSLGMRPSSLGQPARKTSALPEPPTAPTPESKAPRGVLPAEVPVVPTATDVSGDSTARPQAWAAHQQDEDANRVVVITTGN